ncbi:MAG: hypothetical protein AB7F75_09865 [Planctomycetota bacterium]
MNPWRLAFMAVCLPLILIKGLEPLKDPDVAWHVATGRWFLEHGSWPETDPFSHSCHGKPWPIHQAGGALIFALVHQVGGYSLIRFLMLAVSLAFCALIFVHSRRKGWGAPASAILTALFYFVAHPRFLERPFLLSALALLALLVLWDAVVAGRRKAWVAFVATALLATNLHGDYFLAVAVFFLLIFLERGKAERFRALAAWVVLVVIWPFHRGGIDMCWYPIEQVIFPELGWGLYIDVVKELRPPKFFQWGWLQPYLWSILLAGAFLFIRYIRSLRLGPALLVLGLGVMFVQAGRNALPFAMVTVFLLAREVSWQKSDWRWAFLAILPGSIHLMELIPRMSRLDEPRVLSRDMEAWGERARALRSQGWLKGHVLNEFALGGGLIDALGEQSVFVDGRMDVYGPLFLEHNYAPLTKPEGAREWPRIFRDFGISHLAWSFADPSWQPLAGFVISKGWKVAYLDPTKYVLADPSDLPHEWPVMGPDLHEGGFAVAFAGEPDGAESVMTLAGMMGQPSEARQLADWMKEAYPSRPAAHFFSALLDSEPLPNLRHAVGQFPSYAQGHLILARFLLAQDPVEAALEAERGILSLEGNAQGFSMVLETARAFKAAGHMDLLEPVLRRAMNAQGLERLKRLVP